MTDAIAFDIESAPVAERKSRSKYADNAGLTMIRETLRESYAQFTSGAKDQAGRAITTKDRDQLYDLVQMIRTVSRELIKENIGVSLRVFWYTPDGSETVTPDVTKVPNDETFDHAIVRFHAQPKRGKSVK